MNRRLKNRNCKKYMKIIDNLCDLKLNNTIVTLGKFDGNHIGHRLLFDTVIKLKNGNLKTVIFTFDIHPGNILNKDKDTVMIIETNAEREFDKIPDEIDYIIRFPFNKETVVMSPEQFVEDILVKKLGVKIIVAGTDFRFGKNRAGDIDTLKALGNKYGFRVVVMEKVCVQLEGYDSPVEVSSTLIKEEIRKGHMENVARMLGEPFFITGQILHGKHLGSNLGFPTINMIAPENKIMPLYGVYATKTRIGASEYYSMTNVGSRPTFDDGEHITVETNIFDFDQDIYGKNVTVSFYHFIRPEHRFAGVQELKETIEHDRDEIKDYFESVSGDG